MCSNKDSNATGTHDSLSVGFHIPTLIILNARSTLFIRLWSRKPTLLHTFAVPGSRSTTPHTTRRLAVARLLQYRMRVFFSPLCGFHWYFGNCLPTMTPCREDWGTLDLSVPFRGKLIMDEFEMQRSRSSFPGSTVQDNGSFFSGTAISILFSGDGIRVNGVKVILKAVKKVRIYSLPIAKAFRVCLFS